MINSEKPVRVRIVIGRPKRKSGVYPKRIAWGVRLASRRQEEGEIVSPGFFQRYQREEGPLIFDGRKFRLIPYDIVTDPKF